MSGFIVVVVGAVAAIGLFLAHRSRRTSERIAFVQGKYAAMDARNGPRQPDLTSAARAFAGIAILRKHNVDVDLRKIEMTNAQTILDKGGTDKEALSARWGGAMAIVDDLALFDIGVEAYEDTLIADGREPDADPKEKFYAGAAMYLAHVLGDEPGEYERFLRHINK